MPQQQGLLPRLPLVEPLESRAGATTKDPRLFNAFAERDEGGDFRVYKRPGISLFDTISSFPAGTWTPMGLFYSIWPATPLAVFANTSQAYIAKASGGGAAVLLGAAASSPAYLTGFAQNNVASNQVVLIGVNSNLFTFNPSTSTAASVPLPAGSASLGVGFAVLDNTTYFIDTNATVWGSNLNDFTTWNSLNNLPVGGDHGFGVGLVKHHSYLLALRTFSFDFLYDAGNATGSPLAIVPNSNMQWGCVDGNTIQLIEDDIIWLAQSRETGVFIALMRNMQAQKISTPGVDRIIQGVTGGGPGAPVGPSSSFCFRLGGHVFYGLVNPTNNFTLIYDLAQGIWYLWTDQNGNYFPWFAAITQPGTSVLMYNTSTALTNQIFRISTSTYLDMGNMIPVDIYTANYDGGTRRQKMLQRMDFIADQQPAKLYTRHSEDDFQTYSNFREVDLNQIRPTLTDNGTFRRRAYHFRHRAPFPFRMDAVELDVQLCTE